MRNSSFREIAPKIAPRGLPCARLVVDSQVWVELDSHAGLLAEHQATDTTGDSREAALSPSEHRPTVSEMPYSSLAR